MAETRGSRDVHFVEGRPWKDAIIKILEPRSPYRPWLASDPIKQGDAVIAVLDTDPPSVLAGVGTVGPGGDIDAAFSGLWRFSDQPGLLEVGTLQLLSGSTIRPVHYSQPDKVIAAIENLYPTHSDCLFGHTSLAAGRVLINSSGICTACSRWIDLTRDDARDSVHVHLAQLTPAPIPEAEEEDEPPVTPKAEKQNGYGPSTIRLGRSSPPSTPKDWPAVLCDSCEQKMRDGEFTNFLDFRLSLNPACPNCSAKRSMSTCYGMLSQPLEEPWLAAMGCNVKPWEWLCGSCGHGW